MDIYFIDFEASGLGPNSYPIEVGWSDTLGNTESLLIDPTSIDDWFDWDNNVEHGIHGISQTQLREYGEPPTHVAQKLNEVLAGKYVFCDGLPYDRIWLKCLFSYADLEPLFGLQHIDELLMKKLRGLQMVPASHLRNQIEELKIDARNRVSGQRHRAGPDAQYLFELYRLVMQQAGWPMP